MTTSRFASGILVSALAIILPAWVLGLEQILPPVVLGLGALLLLLSGNRLRMPVTAWAFLVFVLVSLLSISALVGARAFVLFARGHFNLVAGFVALVLAANAGAGLEGLERILRAATVFIFLVTALVVGYLLGWLPEQFEVPFAGILGNVVVDSDYFREHILVRRLAVREILVGDLSVARLSTVFLYPTMLAAAMLPLLSLVQAGSAAFAGRWRTSSWLAQGAALACIVATGSRSATALALVLVVSTVPWILLGRKWGMALLVTTLVVILVGASLVLWFPVGDTVVGYKLLIELREHSSRHRFEMYSESLVMLAKRPVFGWGVQEMASEAGGTRLRLGTHSELLNVAYRFGLVGLVLYVSIGAVFGLWYLRRVAYLRRVGVEALRLDLMIVLGLGAFAVAVNGLAHMPQWDVNVFWISWCVPGLAHAVGGAGRAKPAADEELDRR